MSRKFFACLVTVATLMTGVGIGTGSLSQARQPAPESRDEQTESVGTVVERAKSLLNAGEVEPAVRLLLPMRGKTDDPAFIAAFTEALARAAYQRTLALEARGPSATPAARAGDDEFRDQQRRANETFERSLTQIDLRIDGIDRTLSDKGRAEPITERLEQSVSDLKRDLRDLRSQFDRLERTVEQLRWKK